MDGPRDYHTEWNKSDRERQTSYDITYIWNLKKKNETNEFIYKTETHSDVENKFMVTKGERQEGGIN